MSMFKNKGQYIETKDKTMNSINDKIMAATKHRDSSFFCDTEVANSINTINTINKIQTLQRIQTLSDCNSLTIESDISSASLTSPSAAAIEGDCSSSGKGDSVGRPPRNIGDIQHDSELPFKFMKVDLTYTKSQGYKATLKISKLNGDEVRFKCALNTHKKNWKRIQQDNQALAKIVPEHCALVDDYHKTQKQKNMWPVLRISKFMQYTGRLQDKLVVPGLTAVFCWCDQTNTGILNVFYKEQRIPIMLDGELSQAQIKKNFVGTGMIVKEIYTEYKMLNIDNIL